MRDDLHRAIVGGRVEVQKMAHQRIKVNTLKCFHLKARFKGWSCGHEERMHGLIFVVIAMGTTCGERNSQKKVSE